MELGPVYIFLSLLLLIPTLWHLELSYSPHSYLFPHLCKCFSQIVTTSPHIFVRKKKILVQCKGKFSVATTLTDVELHLNHCWLFCVTYCHTWLCKQLMFNAFILYNILILTAVTKLVLEKVAWCKTIRHRRIHLSSFGLYFSWCLRLRGGS